MKTYGKFKVGDKSIYNEMVADILEVNSEDYPRVTPTYKIEVKGTCIQRFWVQERKLSIPTK